MLKIIYHEDYLTNYFTSVAESPLRITAIYNKLKDRYSTVRPSPATREDILRVHAPEHLEKVQQEGIEVYRTALLSAGGALCAARLANEGTPAFAVIRPPGHHARRCHYGGFCFFNNVAVAVASLRETHDVKSAVIIDIDMHHGDGTQDIFAREPLVSVIDMRARERNVYMDRMMERIEAIHAVDLIAVSAGFDLYVNDWGGLLETVDFYRLGYAVHRAAFEKARGRFFAVLEGGYFLNELGRNALAFCQGLEGLSLEASEFAQ
jgi:acetoin utilization deacetylase AcuC-like enzyme